MLYLELNTFLPKLHGILSKDVVPTMAYLNLLSKALPCESLSSELYFFDDQVTCLPHHELLDEIWELFIFYKSNVIHIWN